MSESNHHVKQLNNNRELVKLQHHFSKLALMQDLVEKEYCLIQIAQQYNLPIESVRSMFKDYCHQQAAKECLSLPWWLNLLKTEFGLKQVNCWFDGMSFFRVLEYLSKLSILVGVIIFIIEIPERQNQRILQEKRVRYEAWQIVNASKGEVASGGRIDALQDLNKVGVSLIGLNVENAHLSNIQLKDGRLDFANFKNTFLVGADFTDAILTSANFQEAVLTSANFQGASMFGVNLRGAYLEAANFTGADLRGAILFNTNLEEANLSEVIMSRAIYNAATRFPSGFEIEKHNIYAVEPDANLEEADLTAINLSAVDLSRANLSYALLVEANLTNANLTNTNLTNAILKGANLTDANLEKADLQSADLRGAIGIKPAQVQSARNWREALYDDSFRKLIEL